MSKYPEKLPLACYTYLHVYNPMVKKLIAWYERYYHIHLRLAAFLFGLQLFHLYWLTTHVVATISVGKSYFLFPAELSWLYALVDYTEIPAIVSVSVIYIRQVMKKKHFGRSWVYLVFLNVQWLHLFWITDEVIIAQLIGMTPIAIPPLLAYGAIAIDYLEIPVIIDTAKKAFRGAT